MYTNKDFLHMREQTTKARFAMSDAKAVSYTRGSGDRLNNFATLAARYDMQPREVLAVYMGKHIMALEHWLATGEESSEGIESTLDDIQNYSDLARAMYRADTEHQCMDDSCTVWRWRGAGRVLVDQVESPEVES